MTEKKIFFLSPKFATVALLATGMAASPLALSTGFSPVLNQAAAQSAADNSVQSDENGQATEFVEGSPGASTSVDDDPYAILGTTPEEMREEVDQVMAGTASGPIGEYKEALRSGNLDTAARVLAQASNRPVTENLVAKLNTALGVETNLLIGQISEEAAKRQDPDSITKPMLSEGNPPFDTANMAMNLRTRQFRDYEAALRRNNLDAAAEALASATERPITEDLVRQVNTELGVETNLTITQIAEAAAGQQTY